LSIWPTRSSRRSSGNRANKLRSSCSGPGLFGLRLSLPLQSQGRAVTACEKMSGIFSHEVARHKPGPEQEDRARRPAAHLPCQVVGYAGMIPLASVFRQRSPSSPPRNLGASRESCGALGGLGKPPRVALRKSKRHREIAPDASPFHHQVIANLVSICLGSVFPPPNGRWVLRLCLSVPVPLHSAFRIGFERIEKI